MKRNFISIVVCMVAVIIGAYPVFAQQGARKDRAVSPIQKDPAPRIEKRIKPATQIGIPIALVAVRYRRCPVDGQRLKHGKPIVFEGKVYRLCSDACVDRFWDNPQSVALRRKNSQEIPLTITNNYGMCMNCDNPALPEYCRLYRDTIAFFCSSECRDKNTRGHRTPVSRQAKQEGIKK